MAVRDHFRRVIPQIDPLNAGSRMRRNIARVPAGRPHEGSLNASWRSGSGQGAVQRADIDRRRHVQEDRLVQ